MGGTCAPSYLPHGPGKDSPPPPPSPPPPSTPLFYISCI
jgi:hypothetical protein